MTITAVAYIRTSSAANVGEDKDSFNRQSTAIQAYAKRQGLQIVHTYYDAAVKGTDAIDARPGFAEMIAYMNSNGARTILVESASRFARDLIVQETGYQFLKNQGFTLIAVDDPDAFTADTPTAVMVRQILGAVSQFEKANLVAKLAGARQRKKALTGRCEGRKAVPLATVKLAQGFAIKGLSLRAIAERLEEAGHLTQPPKTNPNATPTRYSPSSVKTMLQTPVEE